jgi:hypothetical protein
MSDKYYFLGVKYLIFMSETKKLNLFSPLCKLCLLAVVQCIHCAMASRSREKRKHTRGIGGKREVRSAAPFFKFRVFT